MLSVSGLHKFFDWQRGMYSEASEVRKVRRNVNTYKMNAVNAALEDSGIQCGTFWVRLRATVMVSYEPNRAPATVGKVPPRQDKLEDLGQRSMSRECSGRGAPSPFPVLLHLIAIKI